MSIKPVWGTDERSGTCVHLTCELLIPAPVLASHGMEVGNVSSHNGHAAQTCCLGLGREERRQEQNWNVLIVIPHPAPISNSPPLCLSWLLLYLTSSARPLASDCKCWTLMQTPRSAPLSVMPVKVEVPPCSFTWSCRGGRRRGERLRTASAPHEDLTLSKCRCAHMQHHLFALHRASSYKMHGACVAW